MSDNIEPADEGLLALVLLLRFHGVAVDPAQIEHQFGGACVSITDMIRCARSLKLRARAVKADWTFLEKAQLPGIAELRGGAFAIVGKVGETGALVQIP